MCSCSEEKNVPRTLSWLDGQDKLYIQLESVQGSKEQLIEMAKQWFAGRHH